MVGMDDDRQSEDEGRSGVPPPMSERLQKRLAHLPAALRQTLVWLVIAGVVVFIFMLASISAWWPK